MGSAHMRAAKAVTLWNTRCGRGTTTYRQFCGLFGPQLSEEGVLFRYDWHTAN